MGERRDILQTFYATKAWRNVRDIAIRRDRYLCVDCLEQGRITPAEEVHHIIPLTPENVGDENISLDLNNLVSLCRECHRTRHGVPVRRYSVDSLGHITIK